MPCTCSVPGCRGNYSNNGPKVSTFRFPKDELMRKRWVVAIRRKDFNVTKYSSVCELHFKKTDFETEISAYDSKTGRTLTAPLSVKRLKKGVVPSLLIPSLDSRSSVPSREDPEEKRTRIEKEQLSLALQHSLESVPDETSQSEDAAESSLNTSTSTPVFSLTEGKEELPQEKGIKRKRKSDKEVILSTKGNDICESDSLELRQDIQEISQSNNLNGNRYDLSSSSALFQKVQIKEEQPWDGEYSFLHNTSKSKAEESNDMVKIVSVESSNENAESTSSQMETRGTISENCDTTFYKKPLKIDKRDEAFGKFVACEMSDLRGNPELYLKTQQSILKLLVEAHFEQMSSM